jgi:chromosome segregation ATPase
VTPGANSPGRTRPAAQPVHAAGIRATMPAMHSDDGSNDALAESQRRLDDALRHLDQERERGEQASRERDALRREITTLRELHDAEARARARAAQDHDLLTSRVSTLEAESNELRREGVRQTQRAEQAARDVDAVRRDLAREQAAHRATQERLAALEASQRGAASELAAEKAAHLALKDQLRRLTAEHASLQERVAGDQTVALEATERSEALAREVGNLNDRLTLLRRQLQDETDAHAATRRKLEEQREATREVERKRRGQGLVSAVGGAAALGLGLILRRRG